MLAFAISVLEEIKAARKHKVLLFMLKCHSAHIPEVSNRNSALLWHTRRWLAAVSDYQVFVLLFSLAHLTLCDFD